MMNHLTLDDLHGKYSSTLFSYLDPIALDSAIKGLKPIYSSLERIQVSYVTFTLAHPLFLHMPKILVLLQQLINAQFEPFLPPVLIEIIWYYHFTHCLEL